MGGGSFGASTLPQKLIVIISSIFFIYKTLYSIDNTLSNPLR
jgi:hypothetical protein